MANINQAYLTESQVKNADDAHRVLMHFEVVEEYQEDDHEVHEVLDKLVRERVQTRGGNTIISRGRQVRQKQVSDQGFCTLLHYATARHPVSRHKPVKSEAERREPQDLIGKLRALANKRLQPGVVATGRETVAAPIAPGCKQA